MLLSGCRYRPGVPEEVVTLKDAHEYWRVRRIWDHDLNEQDEETFVAMGLPRVEIIRRPAGSKDFSGEIVNFRHPETNDILVSQTFVTSPTGVVSVSLACKLHQCRMMIAGHQCPDRHTIRNWVQHGLSLGRGAAFKEEHMNDMRRLLGR